MTSYFYDENRIRYQLYKTTPGKNLNWIFIPGGPGADSRYLKGLLDTLTIPGNQWLIDLPGSGDHLVESDYPLEKWLDIFLPMIERFENVVLVGHSFGAMLPLLFPQLEEKVIGFVSMNASPSLWLEEAAKFAVQDSLPDVTLEVQTFLQNPNDQTFEKYLAACMPYYFPPASRERGKNLLLKLPFRYQTAGWWQGRLMETQYTAQWIPQNVPMLIIGGRYDYITPFSIYANDQRFHRPNIKMFQISEAGHLPWLDQPEAVQSLLSTFCQDIDGEPSSSI